MLSLSRLVADLYAGDGIRCNAVAPGPTATEAWLGEGGLADQQAERSGKSREEVLEAVGKGRPLGRLAEPEEIAAVIAFLCSERASVRDRARPGAPTAAPCRSSSEVHRRRLCTNRHAPGTKPAQTRHGILDSVDREGGGFEPHPIEGGGVWPAGGGAAARLTG